MNAQTTRRRRRGSKALSDAQVNRMFRPRKSRLPAPTGGCADVGRILAGLRRTAKPFNKEYLRQLSGRGVYAIYLEGQLRTVGIGDLPTRLLSHLRSARRFGVRGLRVSVWKPTKHEMAQLGRCERALQIAGGTWGRYDFEDGELWAAAF